MKWVLLGWLGTAGLRALAVGESPQEATHLRVVPQRARADSLNRAAEQLKSQSPRQSLELAQEALRVAEFTDYQAGKAGAYNNIGEYYLDDGNYEKALTCFATSLRIAQDLADPRLIAHATTKLGVGHYFANHFKQALDHQFKALRLYRQLGARADEARALNAVSYVYGKQGFYQKALEHHLRALAIRRQLGDPNEVAKSLNSIGDFYLLQNALPQALESYQESYRTSEVIHNRRGLAVALNNIGWVLSKQGHVAEALAKLNRALVLKRDIGNRKEISRTLNNLALVHYEQRDYANALRYCLEAEGLDRTAGDASNLANTLNNLGRIYTARHESPQSLVAHQQALALAQRTGAAPLLKESYELAANAYLATNEVTRFTEHYRHYLALRDSLTHSTNLTKVQEMQDRYENEKRTQALAQVQLEKKVQALELERRSGLNTLLTVSVLLLLAVVGCTWLLYRTQNRLRQQLQAQNQTIGQQNAALQALNDSKDKFFSILSHDLRGPINTLSSFLSLMTQYEAHLSAEEMTQLAGDIEKKVRNVSVLLEDLLKWSQAQMNLSPFQLDRLPLGKLVAKNVELLTAEAQQKRIQLLAEVAADTCVIGDAQMLDLVLRNLLTNALKFTRPGGQVRVSARQIGDRVSIAVSDTGVGMSPEQLANLFDVGQRKSERGTADEPGTGLGLILCQEFVRQHRSELSVSSHPGEGTTFSFALSAATDQPKLHAAPPVLA